MGLTTFPWQHFLVFTPVIDIQGQLLAFCGEVKQHGLMIRLLIPECGCREGQFGR